MKAIDIMAYTETMTLPVANRRTPNTTGKQMANPDMRLFTYVYIDICTHRYT